MRFSEISNYPDRDGGITNYMHYFQNLDTSPAFSNLNYAFVMQNGTEYYGLINDSNELVSLLVLDERDTPYWQISYTETVQQYRRQGCFRYLLLKALEKHITIISDERQTTDAELAWKSLIRYPSERMQFKMYNPFTDEILDLEPTIVWNGTDDYVVMVSKAHFTESMQARSDKRDQYTRKYNRHFDGIWFGPESSNDEYDNP